MKWLKKLIGTEDANPPSPPPQDPIGLAVDVLMRNLCNLETSLPALEAAGLQKESIFKIYNLTVIACARRFLEHSLPLDDLPDHYLIADGIGDEERTVLFESCEVYQAASGLVGNYGQGDIIVATTSGELQALNAGYNQLGSLSEKDGTARIRMLPPRLPAIGLASSQAEIVFG